MDLKGSPLFPNYPSILSSRANHLNVNFQNFLILGKGFLSSESEFLSLLVL